MRLMAKMRWVRPHRFDRGAICNILMNMTVHLVKLCVGADEIADLQAWQARLMQSLPAPVHHTRMMPKRAGELLDGGSIYWVIRRVIQVRQKITDVRAFTDRGGRSACELVFDPELVLTQPLAKKPFQGWRYLKPEDAPVDLTPGAEAQLPAGLGQALREAMVW